MFFCHNVIHRMIMNKSIIFVHGTCMVHCATVFFTTIVCFSSQPLFCLCSYSFLCRYNKEYIVTVVGASYTVINTANNLCGA